MHSNEAIKPNKLDTDLMINSCIIIYYLLSCLFASKTQHEIQLIESKQRLKDTNCLFTILILISLSFK